MPRSTPGVSSPDAVDGGGGGVATAVAHETPMNANDLWLFLLFLGGWVALNRWVLPRLGVPT